MLARYCEINNLTEIKELKYGMDFRKPEYRREVFLRFYDYHLKFKSHPGGVYFAFPYLSKKFNLDIEQNLWIAYINGCTQNIVTTWLIFEKFPDVKKLDVDKLNDWWNKEYIKFKVGSGWDLDRRYFKIGNTGFPNCVKSYKESVDKFNSQKDFFDSLTIHNDKYKNYEICWDYIRKNFLSFGRLSAFSYLEYLRIQGINVDCNNLYFEDISGSRSHRNGVCKVLGRDDLDWWKTKIKYDKETIKWITKEAELLFNEAKQRINHNDVSYFTFESTLCNYKSWHRPDRRYPNVYMDMFRDRIKYAETQHGNKFDLFWEMRKDCLPRYLRIEDNPKDIGINPIKQNHYRNTGQVIMMHHEYDCFKNDYNDYFTC